MISFENFRSVEGVPIYLQMIRHVKEGLAAGTVRSGDELPSRRVLSATLAVNPNTVQKAYRQLEEEGLIQSRPGAGSCVTGVRPLRSVSKKYSKCVPCASRRLSITSAPATGSASRAVVTAATSVPTPSGDGAGVGSGAGAGSSGSGASAGAGAGRRSAGGALRD